MSKKPAEIHLGMFSTKELLRELSSRRNIEFVVGVKFVDGTDDVDPDTIFCVGRWGTRRDGHAIVTQLRGYVRDAEPEEEDDDPKKARGDARPEG